MFMFGKRRFWISVITVLTAAVTFYISRKLTAVYNVNYWYSVSSIIISELLLGLSSAELMKTDERAMPLRLGNIIVSSLYLIFTLTSSLFLVGNIPENYLQIIHVAVLLFVIIFHILYGIAHFSVTENENLQKNAFLLKKDITVKLSKFKSMHYDWFSSNTALQRRFLSLQESVRFSAESFRGTEDFDNQVSETIGELMRTTCIEDALAVIERAENYVKLRNDAIKEMR